ncbi:HAMP domain-containing histidine kinase [bacterium]|nr:MAG: HAMP domain-containing histidine kinase [bacterium]
MSIQRRLSIIFITLLVFGVTAVSSYSIVFIRDYLLKSGMERLARDTRSYAIAFQNVDLSDTKEELEDFKANSEYGLVLGDFQMIQELLDRVKAKPETRSIINSKFKIQLYHDRQDEIIFAITRLSEQEYLVVTQSEEKLFEPVKTIRWIIYTGMFISIVLILVVSTVTARSLTKPILDLTEYAQAISEGKEVSSVVFSRNDEIGTLNQALNRMALTLKSDTEKLQEMYDRHRQFYADITHEVRNPLHTIGGSLELLELEQLPIEDRKKYIENAQSQLQRINRMFNDLLTLQKFDSNEYRLHKTEFDLTTLLKRVKQSFDLRAQKAGMEILIPNKPYLVWADKDKIEQVFDNLVSNAIFYSGGKLLKISAKAIDNVVHISVSDDGIGIKDEQLSHLFVRFYRADTSRSREKGGSGLGLAVVKSITDAHKSGLEVQSKEGEGTVFRFELTLVRESNQEEEI